VDRHLGKAAVSDGCAAIMVVAITLSPPPPQNFSIRNSCGKDSREREAIPNK